MKFASPLALLVVALQGSTSTAQLNFVRSNDHRPLDFSTLTNPTLGPRTGSTTGAGASGTLPAVGGLGRRLRDGSGVVVVGRNGGGFQPVRGEEPTD
ncbi:unnamed protein product [Phytophthora lilii]|uniref:Unnamed protein product n=1 Tax=Phytophthora lilii TaxID=2077276 RepID=A0A9W6UB27_9STRA|nr:unnamed protein product [Phytophthora lilii]